MLSLWKKSRSLRSQRPLAGPGDGCVERRVDSSLWTRERTQLCGRAQDAPQRRRCWSLLN